MLFLHTAAAVQLALPGRFHSCRVLQHVQEYVKHLETITQQAQQHNGTHEEILEQQQVGLGTPVSGMGKLSTAGPCS